jgi:hypothetical protein
MQAVSPLYIYNLCFIKTDMDTVTEIFTAKIFVKTKSLY